MEKEQILGFDIDVRELSSEEENREITFERFRDFHYSVGEDFCDQCGSTISHKVLAGYLMGLHPEWSDEMLKVCNAKYGEALGFLHIYEEEVEGEVDGNELFYTDLAAFLNLTGAAKRRVNMILIRIDEEYNK